MGLLPTFTRSTPLAGSHKMKREPKKVHVICGLLRGGRTNRPTQELSRITSFLGSDRKPLRGFTTKRGETKGSSEIFRLYRFYIYIYIYIYTIIICMMRVCKYFLLYKPDALSMSCTSRVTAVHPGWQQQMDNNGCNLHEWVLWSIHILMHPNAYIMHGASTPYICSARIHLGFPDFQMLSLWLSSFCPLD